MMRMVMRRGEVTAFGALGYGFTAMRSSFTEKATIIQTYEKIFDFVHCEELRSWGMMICRAQYPSVALSSAHKAFYRGVVSLFSESLSPCSSGRLAGLERVRDSGTSLSSLYHKVR